MQSLRFALQPLVTDISLSWDLPEGVSATALSQPLTALFQGQRSLIFAQLTGEARSNTVLGLTIKVFFFWCTIKVTHGFSVVFSVF